MDKKEYQELLRDGWKQDQDYVFVSYASKDWEKVYPTVLELRKRGINVYIDVEFQEDLSSNWLENFKEQLFSAYCKAVVVFLSIHYMRSYACLIEQLANCTDEMVRQRGEPFCPFYVALEPKLTTLQGMKKYIYEDEIRKAGEKNKDVRMSLAEEECLKKFVLESHFDKYKKEKDFSKFLPFKHAHEVVVTMRELIFENRRQKMPNIKAFDSPKGCARLLFDNLTNDKNQSVKMSPLEGLKRETADRLAGTPVQLEAQPCIQAEIQRQAVQRAQEWCDEGIRYYDEGKNGAEGSFLRAVECFRQAAGAGHAAAQNKLAYCYEKGYGVEKDPEAAFYWYGKSAEQEEEWSFYHLGLCYYKGTGCERSYEDAVIWLTKAAEKGNYLAQRKLASVYGKGVEGIPADAEKAAYWQGQARGRRA